MKVTSNTALIAGGVFVLLLIVGFAKLNLYMLVAAAGVGLISHSLSNSTMGALGAAAITLLILGIVNHYYKKEGFNTNTPPSEISKLLRNLKKSGFEGFTSDDDNEEKEEGFEGDIDDEEKEEGFRSKNDDEDEEEGFRSRDDDDEEEGFRSKNDDEDEEEGFRGFEGFKTSTGKKLDNKNANKNSWSKDAKKIDSKSKKTLGDIDAAIKYLQESRNLTKESSNISSKYNKGAIKKAPKKAAKKAKEGFAGNVFQNISKLGYNVPGFGISGPHVEGYEDVKREKDAIPAPASKNDTLPMPFKLGEIPSQIKNGPHIDAGSTLMKAIQNLNPDQINAMTKDTQQLIETQKSLMSMLGTMKPMLNDGKELMNTFQQMFGQ